MSEGPGADPRAVSMIKAFALCENFGGINLDTLGIPREEQTQWYEAFLIIMSERNKEIERKAKTENLRNRYGHKN